MRSVLYGGWALAVPPGVYEPAEDSFLLAEAARERALGGRCLEVGCGSGLSAIAMAGAGAARVVATDRNPAACRAARENARANGVVVDVVRADLATAVLGPFDLVAFNPPYLPPEEDALPGEAEHAYTGGPTGAEVAVRLVEDLPRLLAPAGRALVLTSSRGNDARVVDAARERGYDVVAVGEERWFFERLTLWEMRRP